MGRSQMSAQNISSARQRPSLKLGPIFKLKCPYCARTPLRAPGSWFTFGPGCRECNYSYEREIGYFSGASWMVSFTVVSLLGFAVAALLLYLLPDIDALWIAAIVGLLVL